MIIEPQHISGCYIVTVEPVADERGFFARVFSEKEFREAGLDANIAQVNLVGTKHKGTIRGIHWQRPPFEEAKLVRCVRGRAFDVCLDVRPESPTWGEWFGVELSAQNRLALYIPRGCGHGYQALEDGTELLYSTSSPYSPMAELGARWDDPVALINWPLTQGLVISNKDRNWPNLARG